MHNPGFHFFVVNFGLYAVLINALAIAAAVFAYRFMPGPVASYVLFATIFAGIFDFLGVVSVYSGWFRWNIGPFHGGMQTYAQPIVMYSAEILHFMAGIFWVLYFSILLKKAKGTLSGLREPIQ